MDGKHNMCVSLQYEMHPEMITHAASATAISSLKCGVAAAQYRLWASICRPRSVYMKLLYAYAGSPRRRRRQLGFTVDRVLNTRPAWSATNECARLRTVTTVSVVVEPPQTVSTPAGEAFLGASEAKTSRSRDDDASMACGFCLRSIITNRQPTRRQAKRFTIGRLIFTRERQTSPVLSQAGASCPKMQKA